METSPERSLRKRLLPLHLGTFLLGMWLWVPVEKLFMNEIGFNAATVGIMAAIYAGVPPLIELPSGILADRWSRRGVLMISGLAATVSCLVGGLSTNVATYFISAFFLGVFFAMRSGTVEAVIYDTVLEETGGSDDYERFVGRIRFIESAALVTSGLAGGILASLTAPRVTYFLTLPFTVLSVIAYHRFREPRLHKTEERTSLRSHLSITYQTVAGQGRLLPIIALAVLTALALQVIFEFGPLWLVALAAAAVVYGPHWAGLMATLGLGGLLAGRLQFNKPTTLAWVGTVMVAAGLTLTISRNVLVVTAAQIALAVLLVAASIFVSRRLHDAVPSTVRAGVASGVGALSWITFLPFALGFGVVTKQYGVHTAGWILIAVTVLVGLLLARIASREGERDAPADAETAEVHTMPTPVTPAPCLEGVA